MDNDETNSNTELGLLLFEKDTFSMCYLYSTLEALFHIFMCFTKFLQFSCKVFLTLFATFKQFRLFFLP